MSAMLGIEALYKKAKQVGAEVVGVEFPRVSVDGRTASAEIMISNPRTQAVTVFEAAGNTSGPFIPVTKLASAFQEIGLGLGSGK